MISRSYGTVPLCSERDREPFCAQMSAVLAGDLTYLLNVDAYPSGLPNVDFAGWAVGPWGTTPWASRGPTVAFTYATTTLRYSDTGYISQGTDNPATTTWAGRLTDLVVSRQISLSPEARADGEQVGDAALLNGDGGLDTQVEQTAIDGRDISIMVGPASMDPLNQYPLTAFKTIFRGTAQQWNNNGDVEIRFGDYSYRLDVPLQGNKYGGTGTYDGTADITGVLKPLAFGYNENVEPILIDPANLIYQFHDGKAYACSAVYDRGAALTPGSDTSNLYSGSTTAGQFRTDLSRGLFQLGSSPTGRVTCDVQGDYTGAVYASTIPAIITRALETKLSWGAADIDYSGFTSLASAVSGEGGIYIREDIQVREFVDRLLSGIGAFRFGRRDKLLRVARLAEPVATDAIMTLGIGDILECRELALPDAIYPPTWRRRVGYQKNNTLQTGEDIAGTVTDARRQYLAQEWRVATWQDANVRTRFVRSKDPEMIQSHLRNLADAQDVADYLGALHGVHRQLLEVVVRPIGHLIEMGDSVRIIYPRFGLSSGKLVRAFPVREDYLHRSVTLHCWG